MLQLTFHGHVTLSCLVAAHSDTLMISADVVLSAVLEQNVFVSVSLSSVIVVFCCVFVCV